MPDGDPGMSGVPVVLVADRDPGLRSEIRSLLEVCGQQVVEASTGVEALERCRRGTVHLALLGVDIPELDGLDVLRLVRQDYSEAQLPVILINRNRSVADFADGMSLGANDYVGWPVEPAEIMAGVDSALRTRDSYQRLQIRHDRLIDALNARSQPKRRFRAATRPQIPHFWRYKG